MRDRAVTGTLSRRSSSAIVAIALTLSSTLISRPNNRSSIGALMTTPISAAVRLIRALTDREPRVHGLPQRTVSHDLQ